MELRIKSSLSHAEWVRRRSIYEETMEGLRKFEEVKALGFKPGVDFTVGLVQTDHKGVRYWPYTFKDPNKFMLAKLSLPG